MLEPLGGGGMGTIHKGLVVGQAGFQRPVVIKKLREASDPAHLRLFVEEARRYALLDHENIGRIFDFDLVAGELSIILEFIDGWSLGELLERHRQLGRRFDVELAVFVVSRVCRALQYVFERARIVHRDISPSNVMTTREGAVKLIDFGIATHSGARDSGLTGKPAYMAPEMVIELRADQRSDLFGLGAVLYEMLTGERLFQGATTAAVLEQVVAGTLPSPKARSPELPDAVVRILEKALEREPGRRFASAAEMGEACEHFLYDKGYGPTNLSLKQYLGGLFPEAAQTPAELSDPSGAVDSVLSPFDARNGPLGDITPVSKPRPPGVAGAKARRILRTRTRR